MYVNRTSRYDDDVTIADDRWMILFTIIAKNRI